MSDAEVMTIGLVAALFFGGRQIPACVMLKEQKYIPGMVSKSQFSRRLQRVNYLFITLFRVLGEAFKDMGPSSAVHGQNPMHTFYQRLVGRGKAKKLVVVAATRKLLSWAWLLFSRQADWNTEFHLI